MNAQRSHPAHPSHPTHSIVTRLASPTAFAGGVLSGLLVTLFGCLAALGHPRAAGHAPDAQGPERIAAVRTDSAGSAPGPVLHVDRAPSGIQIDGRIEEAAWERATRTSDFVEVEPRENAPPPVETSAFLTYDERHLYVAFRAAEPDPTTIRARVTGRDEIFSGDMVGLYLDTYGNASWAYGLFANPLGIQGDVRRTADGEDPGFDVRYRAEGRVTDGGFEVEMAIPFSALRFPKNGPHRWKVHLFRARPREQRRIFSWAPVSRDNACMLCQAGRLRGLENLTARPETRVLPSLVGSKSGRRQAGSFEGGPVTADPSLTINHPIGSGYRAEATINPDFSQIESDPAQLDANTTYALSLPERRPFFQEGSDLLETPLRTMYTRSINAPIGAVKLTRRGNRSGLLVLGARDQQTPMLVPLEERSRLLEAGRSVSSLVRWRRDLGGSSYVGTALTGRRLDQGGSSATLGIDGRKRFGTRYAARWQTTVSRTREPVDSALSAPVDGRRFGDAGLTSGFDGEEFFGHAGFLELERASRRWDTELGYEAVSPSFRAPLGFVNRSAYREISVRQAAIRHPSSRWISRIRPYLEGGRSWNFDGVRKEQWIRPGIVVQAVGQSYVHVAAERIDELFRGSEFGGLWRIRGGLSTRPTRSLEAGLGGRYGAMIARSGSVPRRGVGTELEGRAELRFTRRLRAAFRIQYSELHAPEDGTRFFEGFILRSRWAYQFTPDLSVRTILEYDEFGGTYRFEPLLRYEPAPFTRIYVGSSHGFAGTGTPTRSAGLPLQRQAQDLFFKVQYGFRF